MIKDKKEISVAVIGTGFMGSTHSLAYREVVNIYNPNIKPKLKLIADLKKENGELFVQRYGFENYTTNWQEILEDDEIKIVSIASPHYLHKEMAEACIKANKHVWCEKPLTLSPIESEQLTQLAIDKNVKTSSGFNYMQNPMIIFAKEVIDSGEIGEIVSFNTTENEDFLAHPNTPFDWHCTQEFGGHGALTDMGPHCIALALHLVGNIKKVNGQLDIVIPDRPDIQNIDMRNVTNYNAPELVNAPRKKVENNDWARSLLKFENGASGFMEVSRVAHGKKSSFSFEITGTKGAIKWDQERMNEIKLHTTADSNKYDGFKTIISGTKHPEYAKFCPASGHGLGFNDLKVIEAKRFLEYIETNQKPFTFFDFSFATKVDKVLDKIYQSSNSQQWEYCN